MHITQNGHTVQSMLDKLDNEFKGKAATELNRCCYLTSDGKKCVAGLYIPDGHAAQHCANTIASTCVRFPDLEALMPLELSGMTLYQRAHDDLNNQLSVNAQRDILKAWIAANVCDAGSDGSEGSEAT